MGRSKFPGKPSKSVMKERIRVLYKNENGRSEKVPNKKNNSGGSNCNVGSLQPAFPKDKEQQDVKLKSTTDVESTSKSACSKNDPAGNSANTIYCINNQNLKHSASDILGQDETNNDAASGVNAVTCGTLNPKSRSTENLKNSLTELDKVTKKKTVTFKNVLETSDDTLVIKKIHNPLNKGPLVSIMKKECHASQGYLTRGDVIVRPSRLTEILKNNENIDKTKSLSFRSSKSSNLSENKIIDVDPAAQYRSPSRERSPTNLFLGKDKEKKDFTATKRDVEKLEQSNEDSCSPSLDMWKLCPKSDDVRDDHISNDYRKRSPKKKDSTVHNKIILRQPRLHFEPQSEIIAKGKQSILNNTNNANLLTTNLCTHSVCGVCNTIVNSKNLQNRKYGIIACDACRKFISKITKKTVSSSTNPLTVFKIQCSKRDGECVIPSLPKNNIKSFKKIYDERCSACWLRKCIKSFHFPSGHKFRLNAILSEPHKSKIDVKAVSKSLDSLSSSSVNTFKYGNDLLTENDCANKMEINPLSWKTITSSGVVEPPKLHHREFTSTKNIVEPLLDGSLSFDVFTNGKQSQCGQLLTNNGSCTSGKNNRLYPNTVLHKKIESADVQSTNSISTTEYPKRQKIDFKGPRVKHVCRSASIALGQQIATFSNEDEEMSKIEQSKSDNTESTFTNSLLGNMYFSGNDQENCSQKPVEDSKDLRNQLDEAEKVLKQGFTMNGIETKRHSLQNPFASVEKNQVAPIKDRKPVLFENKFSYGKNNCQLQKSAQKYSAHKNVFMLAHRNISSLSKRNLMRITKARNLEKKPKIISIDFWDTYAPAEVSQTGFGLILTEPAPICAICFLCGSMDLDYLLFCASCCEPYHSYCIHEEINSNHTIFSKQNIAGNTVCEKDLLNQLNWVCPRCTICYTCNMSSGEKIKCQKCKKNYHSTCMGTSKGLLGADRPLICGSCLKCQTCSTTKVSKYVGNQPICMQCFKLRWSGSRCPLCNNLFDNILDLIILECDICEKLIHVKCEGLTEEQSNLLSNLPGNTKFVCKKCSLANDNAKTLAKEWRDAVYEELKTGLLDVLKLLSRSRQASVLKIDLIKICPCGFDQTIKKKNILSNENFTISHIKEGLNGSTDCILKNPVGSSLYSTCSCSNGTFQQSKLNNSLSLFDVKKKIINGEYVSLFDFNADMNDIITPLKNDELILAYKEILSEKFSWFQNETKTCTDALEEDMFESCNYSFALDEIVTEDQTITTKLPQSLEKAVSYLKQEKDNRVCLFCLKEGDGGVLQESRLLYYGYNSWVHANCALWSSDVYEEFDGTLQNVHKSLNQGKRIKCTICKWSGATIKCVVKTCCSYYHFQCARKSECVFKADKAVYCSTHCHEDKSSNVLTTETFTVFRPLYIEFDKSRKQFMEPSKVQFMVGSLSVLQLGTVYSKFSDTSEAIVPINFICTRLYWSCREPWKLVKYRVRTMIQHSSVSFANDIGKNFTVDHSNNVNQVESALSQIASWHNTLIHEENFESNLNHEYIQFNNHRFSTDNDNPGENISDVCVEEEPQNNSDLLPPEIKDAIFEDLPHDILDGISMLDIFPKLMIYEDLIGIEGKSDNMLTTEPAENCGLQGSEDGYNFVNKQGTNNKFSYTMNHMEDTILPTGHFTCPKRELHRRNSEIFLRNVEGYRSQQRSSSVAWSCKFDSTRRHFAKGVPDVGLNEAKINNSNNKKFEGMGDDCKSNLRRFDEGNLTEIKKETFKLMQLDGTDDTVVGYISNRVTNAPSKSPVKCDRCHCTYRTLDSFQRHLATCEQISTSESETETSSLPPDTSHPTIVFQDESIKNNLQLYHNHLANNQIFQAPISIISEPSVIASDHMDSQNIFVTNTSDYQEGFYVNYDNSGVQIDSKNNNGNNIYEEKHWQNINSGNVNRLNNKCIVKNKKNKCKLANPNSKGSNEQYKMFTNSKQETIVTPEAVNNINNTTEYGSNGKHNYLQFLNQQLVLNNQYSQKDQQSQQQQYVVIQQSVGNNQPLYIQQVANQNTIPQNIFPVVLSNNSLQYASIPTSTNPLIQGSILQTDPSGNVILSSGLQMLSMPSLQLTSQASPQLVGAFNQQPSLHLGSNQMIIGSTGTMELMPNHNQVLLAAPPVYYGLETIVHNTVMSSQQFVSTAMQGVLSQNASFSATTTQVFQSSKFEPVNDAPSGYVVLNNADGTALVVPQSTLLSGFLNTNNSHDFHNNYTQDLGNICGTHHTTFLQQPQQNNVLPLIPTLSDIASVPVENALNQIQATVNLENNSHIASPGKQTIKFVSKVDNTIPPKNSSNTICPNSIQNPPICNNKMSLVEENPRVANDYSNDFNVHFSCKDEQIYGTQTKSAEVNKIHLNNRVQLKSKVGHKYFKKSKVCKNTEINSKILYKNILQKEFKLNRHSETVSKSFNNKSKIKVETQHKNLDDDNVQALPMLNPIHSTIDTLDCPMIENKSLEGRTEMSESYLGLNDSIQNIVPISNNRATSQPYLINATKLPITTPSYGINFNHVPTNIVAPILQTHSTSNTPSRPTNRVLPMQSIHKPVDKSKLKSLTLKRPSFRESINRFIDTSSDMETKNKTISDIQNVEQIYKEMTVIEQTEFGPKNSITPEKDISETDCRVNQLSILEKLPELTEFLDSKKSDDNLNPPLRNSEKDDQKDSKDQESNNLLNINQIPDEKCSKSLIESAEVFKDTLLQKARSEPLTQNECLDVDKGTESPRSDFKNKSPKHFAAGHHSCQAISALPSKKKSHSEDLKKDPEPYLMYEIQSEDGFSYKSKSIADIWEKVFESVQSARRLHGLSALPIGPFADMCGVQMIGLKTNALKYLIEQLPGTEDCTKYTPKYHKNLPSNTGSEYQNQEDLLENTYGAVRCEPFVKRSDYDLFSWLASRHRKQPKQIFVQPSDTELIARRCTANLPMAMKYRTLKETCKYSVGVFRSLIHGRGLFCIKDIEAGEMVIEYAGELIRSTLTDKRERFYDSRGIGCYMFKIDDNFVVDATMRGNAARFINHSCEPNCYSKVVDILGHKHIIIFSLRRIVQGEELTYDYKFPFEDVKIPCSCGSKKCRKYLN